MNDKFGKFDWKCWKDEKPDKDKYVYTFFPKHNKNDEVDVQVADDVYWEDEDYWCYVYMPDAPVIDKKITLEDKVEKLTCLIDQILTNHDRLLDKVLKLELNRK